MFQNHLFDVFSIMEFMGAFLDCNAYLDLLINWESHMWKTFHTNVKPKYANMNQLSL